MKRYKRKCYEKELDFVTGHGTHSSFMYKREGIEGV